MLIPGPEQVGQALFLLLIALLCSCNSFVIKNTDHPNLVNPIIAHVDELCKTNPEGSIVYFDTKFSKIPNPGVGDLYTKYSYKQSFYFTQGDYFKALLFADSALNILQPHSGEKAYNVLYAEAHLDKGDVLFKLKRFNEAYLEFYEGRTSILTSENECDHPLFFFNFNKRLADISYGMGRFLDAAAWYKKAIAALQNCGHIVDQFNNIQGNLDNIALSYSNAGKLDSAMYYYNQTLELLNSVSPKDSVDKKYIAEARGVVLGNLGTVYLKQGKLALAEQEFKRSIAINAQKGYASGDAMITSMKLVELYLKTSRVSEARLLLNKINSTNDTTLLTQYKLKLILLNANYAGITGNIIKANILLQQYIDQINAFGNENKALMSTDFTRQFELLKRQYDLTDLKKKDQRKDFFLSGVIVICLLSILLVYLLLKSSRQEKANARQTALYNKQLKMTLGALEKSNQDNAQLLGMVVHDLKNPLSAIYSVSAIMTNDEGRSEDDLEMLEIIKVSSKKMNLLIHDLLAAKTSNDPVGDGKVTTDLRELLQESISLLQYRAEEKGQRIIIGDTQSCLVHIGRNSIWRVINNLIVNAIKFSAEHTVINLDWECTDKEVTVSVKDQGIGIPVEFQDKIFQLSTEAKRPGTAGEETFGLGLFISRQIIDEQGGKIWFKSKPGKGTTFYFSLPLV